jgi:putative regulator of septum formation
MRGWLAVAAASCLLLLAGCGKPLPAGADGNLVDDWPTLPAPQQLQPHVGDCLDAEGADLTLAQVVPCTAEHVLETTYVGTFSGADAEASGAPQGGSLPLSNAYAACAAPTRTYLGGDWHSALLDLEITVPDAAAWQGGARWFRCGVRAISSPARITSFGALISFKDLLKRPGHFAATCINWVDHKTYVDQVSPVDCATPHSGEYVGFVAAPFGPYPARAAADKFAQENCEAAVAHYLGFGSVEQDFNDSVGWLPMNFDQSKWSMGDRTTRCYAAAATKDGKFTASVKGIKNKPATG